MLTDLTTKKNKDIPYSYGETDGRLSFKKKRLSYYRI